MSEWIACSERMPPLEVDVLAYGSGPELGHFLSDVWRRGDLYFRRREDEDQGDYAPANEIFYWMPITPPNQ